MYINDSSQTPGVYSALGCLGHLSTCDRSQEGFCSEEAAARPQLDGEVRVGTKVNDGRMQGIYFSRRRWPSDSHLTLNVRNIIFISLQSSIAKLRRDCT
jgi:hypothetical protein